MPSLFIISCSNIEIIRQGIVLKWLVHYRKQMHGSIRINFIHVFSSPYPVGELSSIPHLYDRKDIDSRLAVN